MLHRYISLTAWHRRQGSVLRPPPGRPPRIRIAADDDPGFADWIQKVADYLGRLDQETQKQLQRLGHPVKLLSALAQRADSFWFQADKLRRLVDARGQAADQLDSIVNTLATNLAISNEYLTAVLEHSDRIQGPQASHAAEQILDITHADQVALAA